MNLMAYDAMTLGPKELSLGLDVLRQRMDEARFPILSANAVLADSGDLLALPYTVLQVGSYRLGIIGLTRPVDDLPPDVRVLDPQGALERYLPEISIQVDTVILLTNLGYRRGIALVQAVPGVDLLVAALPNQLPAQAVRVPDTGTLVVTAEQPFPRHTGRQVGRLVVTLDGGETLVQESWASVSMGPQIPEDFQMRALLSTYLQQ
jgi:2',3'-cyclic-nucleotide 2'-phosphodiesterase (5'-nucleotidase family)